MSTVEKVYKITASENVHRRFNAFLAFMHYNAGHTGTFAMSFDGDGSDVLKVDPAPPKELVRKMHLIGVGDYVECANQDGNYYSIPRDFSKSHYISNDEGLWKVPPYSASKDQTKELVKPAS